MGALPGIELPAGVSPTCRRGAAKEMGHRVVGEVAVGAGGVNGPAYRVAVGLELRAVAGMELRGHFARTGAAVVWLGQLYGP